MTEPVPYPDTPQHRAAHTAAQRALAAGYRPVLTADETGTIVVLIALTPDQLDQLLNDAYIGAAARQAHP